MSKKIIFRIIGALASALIIVSVFVPFINVTGYTTNLWESFETTKSLYLPIMIIVFGAIGVIFFALNIKTEFAYMSTGAISFFVIMRTIDILNQGTFHTLSIGYYFLVIGAVLTGIMAFLTNLKTKEKAKDVVPAMQSTETTMLDQIDKLYNDQVSTQTEISPIQPVDSVVTSIPVQPIEQVISQQLPIEQPQPLDQVQVNQIMQPTQQVQPVPQVEAMQQPVNPVLQEFAMPISNPVIQEFSTPQMNQQSLIQERPVSVPISTPTQAIEEPVKVNPVINEFTNSSVAPQQSNDLDIFG